MSYFGVRGILHTALVTRLSCIHWRHHHGQGGKIAIAQAKQHDKHHREGIIVEDNGHTILGVYRVRVSTIRVYIVLSNIAEEEERDEGEPSKTQQQNQETILGELKMRGGERVWSKGRCGIAMNYPSLRTRTLPRITLGRHSCLIIKGIQGVQSVPVKLYGP